jgi:PhoH-like ATPase
MPKTYVLDTNVFLHDPKALHAFKKENIVIPFSVIEEIDNQKKNQNEIGRHARIVSQELDKLRAKGHLSEGVSLPNGGNLIIEINHQDAINFPQGLDPEKYDNRILAVAYNLSREKQDAVILVTKDLNLRIKADVLGIRSEDFYSDKVDYAQLYTGTAERYVSPEEMDVFFRDGALPCQNGNRSYPHCFFVLKSSSSPSQSALARYAGKRLRLLQYEKSKTWGIKARNKEQKFAMDLLLDDSVKIVTLVGRAGTGKTLLALSVGLDKVLQQSVFSRLLITRPLIPMGNDIGYLPGSKEEKLRPWMQPIYDNLELLFLHGPEPYGVLDNLLDRGVIEMEALTFIRGRSIPNQFILCDEAQNLSPNMIKTLITRVGEGSKIVFTGDPDQIDHPYLDASSNGLTYLVEKMKEEVIAGHVTLIKGERSEVAELGAKLL